MTSVIEEFWFRSAVVYSKLNTFMIQYFGIDKVGFFLRKIKQPRVFEVTGLLFQFEPEVSTSFGRMLGGRFNEEGTHKLIHRIFESVQKVDLFIDVGANIGEFVVSVAASQKVDEVIGFEPNPACIRSCSSSLSLNGLRNVTLIQKVLTDSPQEITFDLSGENANAHSIFDQPSIKSRTIQSSTID